MDKLRIRPISRSVARCAPAWTGRRGRIARMTNAQKTDTLLPVYLVVGEDELKRRTVLDRLRKRLERRGDIAFNSDEFDGAVATGEAVVAACNTVPFASDVRLVQVDAADKLKKADADALIDYLGDPSPTTVLALVATKLAKNTRLYKAVAKHGKSAVIDCSPIKRSELPRTVRSMAVTHGFTMTDGAARALVAQVGESTVALDNELKKIAVAHRGNDPVSEHEVLEMVARTAEVKPWEFVDAFSARNAPKALWCLGRMESVSPHALLAMCTTRLRELITARALVDRGTPHALASVLKVPDWRVKNHVTWARGFTSAELRAALKGAALAERAMKSGANADERFLLWALEVMRPRNRS